MMHAETLLSQSVFLRNKKCMNEYSQPNLVVINVEMDTEFQIIKGNVKDDISLR